MSFALLTQRAVQSIPIGTKSTRVTATPARAVAGNQLEESMLRKKPGPCTQERKERMKCLVS